jgi:hypothetical protein
MIKLAISGKAGSGKDTLARLITKYFIENSLAKNSEITQSSLADPIKEIVKTMFPRTDNAVLYGPSINRSRIIENAFKDGEPLTYRTLLQDIGTDIGRKYTKNIWLDIMDYKVEDAEEDNKRLFIIPDVRYTNEFYHVKEKGFFTIRLKRQTNYSMLHSSEIEQDQIKDSEFNYVIDNNFSLDSLYDKVVFLVSRINAEK